MDKLRDPTQPWKAPNLLRRHEVVYVVQLGSQALNELLEGSTFTLETSSTRTRGWRCRRGVLHDAVAPDLVQDLAEMELPVDGGKKCKLILVDFRDLEPRDLTPGPCRVIAILEPLRGENQGRKEHTSPTLQNPTSVRRVGLLHGEIMRGNVRLDQDEVVESHLKRRVTRARTAQSLFDELPERQDARAGAKVGAARNRRSRPYGFHDVRGRIWIGG
jgi:hypothetical protein